MDNLYATGLFKSPLFQFDVFKAFYPTLFHTDGSDNSTRNDAEGEEECEWHVVVPASINDSRRNEWPDKG